MRAKVIKRFRDKNTKNVHNVGTFYEGAEERIKELQGKKWLEEVEQVDHSKLLENKVDIFKEKAQKLSKDQLEVLLNLEKETKKRKGIIEFIESLLLEPLGEGE